MADQLPTLAEYPFVVDQPIRFRDIDMLGHVNNAVYATYFESARIACFLTLTKRPLEQLGLILAETKYTFRVPVRFEDHLKIGVRIPRIGNKSFTMEYGAFRARDGLLMADGSAVVVAYDYATEQTIRVPEHFRAAVDALNRGQ